MELNNKSVNVRIKDKSRAILLRGNKGLQSKPLGKDMLLNKKRREADIFLKTYYDSSVWARTYYLGYSVLKCPLDLWIYQEIIYQIQPDLIIETGTYDGGSALYMAHVCDIIGTGEILTIDINYKNNRPSHSRIQYLLGSSTSDGIIEKVKDIVVDRKNVMVILDSDHTEKHVYSELQIYSKFVSKGSYLIVEDGIINGNPVRENFGPGPAEAVEKFLGENNEFKIDYSREKFLVTFNPKGYLRKIK